MKRINLPVRLLLMLLLATSAACEMPVAENDLPDELATGRMTGTDVRNEADGTTYSDEGDQITVLGPLSDNKVALLITGSAKFSFSQLPQLRMNARQTAGGDIQGGGMVTLYSTLTKTYHTTSFTPVCIKPVSGWGRTNYGVTMELAEPWSAYGGLAYSHVIVSLTEDGHVAPGLVLNVRPSCGGTITLVPPNNRTSGNMVIEMPGK
jgi:hypothetical protein